MAMVDCMFQYRLRAGIAGAGIRLRKLIETQAERTPGEAAGAALAEESPTRRELRERAESLARHLVRLGAGPKVRVSAAACPLDAVGARCPASIGLLAGKLGRAQAVPGERFTGSDALARGSIRSPDPGARRRLSLARTGLDRAEKPVGHRKPVSCRRELHRPGPSAGVSR